MKLKIGGRVRPNNEAVSSISYSPMYDVSRRMVGIVERWDTSGRLIPTVAGQPQMTAFLNQLSTDISQSNVDLVYLEDVTNAPTALKLIAADCLRGPYILDLGLPNQADDVYATGMTYRVIWEALKPYGSAGNALLDFNETIIVEPGGETFVMVGGAVNYPERQLAFQNKPYTYIQSGSAVGMYATPNPPGPIWPFAAVNIQPRLTYSSPRQVGNIDVEFGVAWEYRFEWHVPLIGSPHRVL